MATLGVSQTPQNRSLERISATGSTQNASNWAISTTLPGWNSETRTYIPGGTPGRLNSKSCPADYRFDSGECVYGTAYTVGTFNQVRYENDWCECREWSQEQIDGFNEKMLTIDADVDFDRDLSLARPLLEESLTDENAVEMIDTVDISLIGTHASAWGNMCLREIDNHAYIQNMHLGDDGRGLSLLGVWACSTMKGNTLQAFDVVWDNAFTGGLKYAVGFEGSHYRGPSLVDDGKRFATKLIQGQTIKDAFTYAMQIYELNEPAVMSAGRSEHECIDRLWSMTLTNMRSAERIVEDDVSHICKYVIEY